MSKLQKALRGCLKVVPYLFLATVLSAQPKDNAPYSRLGLGEPVGISLSAAGFGGMTAAYNDPLHTNLLNPASYGWLNAATFEAGFYGEYSKLSLKGESQGIWSGNLSHLSLAFPMHNPLNDVLLKKQRKVFWGMGLSLLPNTTVGYDIETTEVHPEVDTVTNSYQGSGGTNRLVWGNSLRYKNFSAGVNLSYVFGQIESERQVRFDDLPVSYTDRFLDNVSIRGFQWSVGAQYRWDIDRKKVEEDNKFYSGRSIVLGAFGNSSTSFNTKSTVLRIGENSTYLPLQSDTLLKLEDVSGKGKLPAEFTLGFMFQKAAKYRFGAEYNLASWSQYENDAKPETLFDSRRIAVGGEYIPDAGSLSYLKRVRYRAGFYHRTDPRLEDLTQYALTVGFGLPVILPRQQTSFVNLAFELGQYNTSNAIKETFVKMSVGFTLNDGTWFFKRKFG